MPQQLWYLTKDGQRLGPYTARQLKELVDSGRLQRSDLIWTEELQEPIAAGSLKSLFNGAPTQEMATPPLAAESNAASSRLVFDCPHCGHRLQSRSDLGGQQAKCAGCGTPVTIPVVGPEPQKSAITVDGMPSTTQFRPRAAASSSAMMLRGLVGLSVAAALLIVTVLVLRMMSPKSEGGANRTAEAADKTGHEQGKAGGSGKTGGNPGKKATVADGNASNDVRASLEQYRDALGRLAAASKQNPRFRIVGQIRDRAGDVLQIWGKAVPVDGDAGMPGLQLEDGNLLVMNADQRSIAFNYYRGAIHYYLGRSTGKNAFGLSVPVFSYGEAPAKLKSLADEVDKRYEAYRDVRRAAVGAALAKIGTAGGDEGDRLKKTLATLSKLSTLDGVRIGDPRDRAETLSSTVGTVTKTWYFIKADKAAIVTTSADQVLAITYILDAERLRQYYAFPKTFDLAQSAAVGLDLGAPLLSDRLADSGWLSRSTTSRWLPELTDVYLRDANNDPELDDYHFLCLSDGKLLRALAVTVYNSDVVNLDEYLLPVHSTNADIDPLSGENVAPSIRPKRNSSPLPAIKYAQLTRKFAGQAKPAVDLALSGNGDRAATASQDGAVRLWHVRSGRQIHQFVGHTGGAKCVAYAAGTELIVSGGVDGKVRVWNAATKQASHELTAHTGNVLDVAVSDNGEIGISGGADKAIHVWNLKAGTKIKSLPSQADWITAVAISRDGTTALTGCRDGSVTSWEIAAARSLHRFEQHKASIRTVAFSPDAKRAISAGDDKVVLLWDTVSGKTLRRFEGRHEMNRGRPAPDGTPVTTLAIARLENCMLSGHESGMAYRWNLDLSRQLEAYYEAGDNITNVLAVGCSPDARSALTSYGDGTIQVRVFPPLTKAKGLVGELVAFGDGAQGGVLGADLSPDGEQAFYLLRNQNNDFSIGVGEIASGSEVRRIQLGRALKASVLSPDGRHAVVTREVQNHFELWDLEMGRLLRQVTSQHAMGDQDSRALASACSFSADGKYVYYIDCSRHREVICNLVVAEVIGGRVVRRISIFKPGDERVDAPPVFYAAASARAATVHAGQVTLWDLETGNELGSQQGGTTERLLGKQLSNDGTRFLIVDRTGSAHAVDIVQKKHLPTFSVGAQETHMRLSPDGRWAAVYGKRDHAVTLHDVTTGRKVRTFAGHDNIVGDASFSPDGKRLLSVGDRTIRLWDADSEKELIRFKDETGSPKMVRFSRDGRLAITVDEGGMVRVWGLPDRSGQQH